MNTLNNNVEEKSKFFAMYFGQNVMGELNYKVGSGITLGEEFVENSFLNLKPLSLISDDDAIELVRLKFLYDKGDVNDLISIKVAKSFDRNGFSISLEAVVVHKKWNDFVERVFIGKEKTYSYFIDYLRSKGYLVPYLNYTIEEIIEMGWVRVN